MRTIYLDYNATTPTAPLVQEAMLPFLAEQFGHPLSDHAVGRAAAQAISDARTRVAQAIGAASNEIYFTSGATESNALAMAIGLPDGDDARQHLVTSSLEHVSLTAAVERLQRRGCQVTVVPCDAGGRVDTGAVESAIGPDTRLVSVMHANNEIGTIQPVAEISELCRGRSVLFHSDAAQSFGKVPVDVDALGVDLLTITAHKFYGPKGAAALYVRRGTPLGNTLFGLGAEYGLLPGTPDVAAIVGMGHAAALATESLGESMPRMRALRDRLQQQLQEAIGPELVFHGRGARLPNTLCGSFSGVAVEDLLDLVPELCVARCAATDAGGAAKLSPTLQALGISPEVGQGTIRLSVGWYTEEVEIDRAASLLIDAWQRLAGR